MEKEQTPPMGGKPPGGRAHSWQKARRMEVTWHDECCWAQSLEEMNNVKI